MAVNRIFGAISLTQGSGSLSNIDPTAFQDDDMAIAKGNSNLTTGGHDAEFDGIYFYRWESSRTDTHNIPFIVKPDLLTAGQPGRWLLISPTHFMENLVVDPNARIVVNKIVGNDAGLILGYKQEGPALSLTISNPGTGFSNGSYPAEPTSGGSGTGLTVDVTVAGGVVSGVVINNAGTDYLKYDVVTLDNFAGAELIISSINNISIQIKETTIEIVPNTRFFGVPSFEVSTPATAPFSVNGNQTMVNNLNAQFIQGEPRSNISLLNGTGSNYSVLPQVTNAATVYPTLDAELVTKKWVDDQLAAGSAIDHGTLTGLGDDDHTQYVRVSGDRTGVGFTGVISGQTPTIAAHLATKGYVDGVATGLGISNYLRREGINAGLGNDLTFPIRYDSSVNFATLDVNSLYMASVGYVKQSLTNHSAVGDPHTVYVKKAGDNITGRITSSLLTSTAQGNLTTRAEVDSLITGLYTKTSGSDGYTDINSNVIVSNIVRRDWPRANRTLFKNSNLESADNSLVTYAYLYARLGNLLEYDDTITLGIVKEISLTSPGTSGYTTTTGVATTPITGTGVGLTVDVVASAGVITSVTINNPGTGYNNGDLLSVNGGTGGQITTDDVVLGALHGDLLGRGNDDHTQYILVSGTRPFDNTIDYPQVANSAIDPSADHHLATKKYVDNVVGASGTVSDVNNINGSVDIYGELGALSINPENPAASLTGGATTTALNTRFVSIPRLNSTTFSTHLVNPSADYTNGYELTSKAYVDAAVSGGVIVQGVVTTQGDNPLINNQIYTPKYPHDYFLSNQDASVDSSELINKEYVDSYIGLSLVSDTDEYLGFLYETVEETGRVSSLVATVNDGSSSGLIVQRRNALKGGVTRVQIIDGGDGFVSFNPVSASFPQTFGTGTPTNKPTFDAAGVNSTYTETNIVLNESGNVTADIRPAKIIGDIGIVEIENGGSGYGASTTVDIYFSGDGAGAVWEGTTDGAGTITSVQRKAGGSATIPYTYISGFAIDDSGAGGIGAIINGFIVGEIVRFERYDEGTGYVAATFDYEGQVGTVVQDDGFTWSGYGTNGTDPTNYTYVTFINANDEKLAFTHYTPTTVPTSTYNISSGNTISQITFDAFGHVESVSQVGQVGMPWVKWTTGDLAFGTAYFVDTSGGSVTLDMSATPTIGDTVVIDDWNKNSFTNNITVRANAGATLLVEGVSSNLIIDVNGARVIMTYVDGTYGWRYKVI